MEKQAGLAIKSVRDVGSMNHLYVLSRNCGRGSGGLSRQSSDDTRRFEASPPRYHETVRTEPVPPAEWQPPARVGGRWW